MWPLFGCGCYYDTINLAQKRGLYLGCILYLSIFFEVYALIRSVAFIRVLLLFGGGVTPLTWVTVKARIVS